MQNGRSEGHTKRYRIMGGSMSWGGYDSNPLNDVWSSADGKNWSQETAHADWSARGHQAVVFPPELVLWGVGEKLTATAGIAEDLHTFTAQYGRGDYSYSLTPAVSGFAVNADGVLSAQSGAAVGEYTLIVWVEDAAGNRAQTALRVDVVAQSTAQSHPFSPIISPPASGGVQVPHPISPPALGGGASALALAGGGLSLLIIPPPTSAEGEK